MENNLLNKFKVMNFKVKKYSPELLIVAGVVGTVASAFMACKATTKLDSILENSKNRVNVIHECMDNEELLSDAEYTKEDGMKDLVIIYTQTGLELAKLYGPSILLGALSLTSILASHNVLRKRNIALAAAYTTIDRGFKEYRNRVVNRFGKDTDRELKFDIKATDIEATTVDKNGKEKITKEKVNATDIELNGYSSYAKFFDESNPNWQKDSEFNLHFLTTTEKWANDKLRSEKYLFLNDIYDMLGIPRTKAGQIVGWTYDKENPIGDNYIDFNIYDIHKPAHREFVNGYERSILLDFNVDGNIWELM